MYASVSLSDKGTLLIGSAILIGEHISTWKLLFKKICMCVHVHVSVYVCVLFATTSLVMLPQQTQNTDCIN